MKTKPFTVLVGSGGLKPFSIYAMVSHFKNLNITPDTIIGCSGGAIAAAYWAAGFTLQETMLVLKKFRERVKNREMLSHVDYRALLAIANYPLGEFDKSRGLLRNDDLLQFYGETLGRFRIEQLPIKIAFYATDLDTGEPVMIRKGNLAEAVYASGALYPMLPPIKLGGRWLVDGAYNSSLPLMEAVKAENEVILALSFDQPEQAQHKGFLQYFCYFVAHAATVNDSRQIPLAIDMHNGEIVFVRYLFDSPIQIWEVDKIPMIMEFGEKVFAAKKDEIMRAISL